MAQAETQIQETGKKSSYGHFMLEAQKVVEIKEQFKVFLQNSDFAMGYDREQTIRLAKSMANDEVFMVFSTRNNARIRHQIGLLEGYNAQLLILERADRYAGKAHLDALIRLFEDSAYKFLAAFSQAQFDARLGLQTVKEKSDIDKFFGVLDVPKTFKNSFGVTISPEMLMLSQGLVMRAMRNWDNVLMIDAMPGTGKTTFDYALATTMLDCFSIFYAIKVKFDTETNVIVTETREYCNKLVSSIDPRSILMFIEAGNQFSSKKFYDDDQYELVNTVERIRFHGLTMLLEWNTVEGLDKTIRDRRATLTCTIEERGKAVVRGFNRNPSGRGLTANPRTKGNVALTAGEANQILEEDALKVLTVPFYELPKDAQTALDDRKERASKYTTTKRLQERYYAEFLCGLPDNIVRITNEELEKYGVETHHVLSMRKLAMMISENIGLGKTTKILVNTDMADPNAGYIVMDDYMRSYVRHLKAEMVGAVQFQKEQEAINAINDKK